MVNRKITIIIGLIVLLQLFRVVIGDQSMTEPLKTIYPTVDISYPHDTNTVKVDGRLVPYFNDFIKECNYYGIDTREIYSLDQIIMQDVSEYEIHGLCTKIGERGNILISDNLYNIKDTIGLKLTVFHEIGHWMGLEHSDVSGKTDVSKDELIMKYRIIPIMSEGYCSCDSVYFQDNWCEVKEQFFNSIIESKD